MKRVTMIPAETPFKHGDKTPPTMPNITESCILENQDGSPAGFFLTELPEKLNKLINLANQEFLTERVPKSLMSRGIKALNEARGLDHVYQYSTIIGSIPPKPHMKRAYATRSSVHNVKKAKPFVQAMYLAAMESGYLIRDIMPEQYERQKKILEKTPKKWRFGELFTSSISNFNISAAYHQDKGNLKDTVNVIITKRNASRGGNLSVPQYGATIDQVDNSILVYPAWRDMHGVTPIEPLAPGGYRNSLIFYPLKAFQNL